MKMNSAQFIVLIDGVTANKTLVGSYHQVDSVVNFPDDAY